MTVKLNRTTAQIKHLFSALTSRTIKTRRLLVSTVCLVAIIAIVAPVAVAQAQVFKGHQWPVSNKCRTCHIGDAAVKYRHARVNFFAARHGQVKCVRCHANNKYTLNRLKCWSCHKKTHGPKITRGCKKCHGVRAWRPARPKHKNKISVNHNKLRCSACHKNNRYAGLTWACFSCHRAPHSASFGKTCGSCHARAAWNPVSMNHAVVTAPCSACHTPPAGHSTGACSQCHSTSAWKPASGTHTISLTGDHTTLACTACHENGVYTGLTWTCTSCHAIEHSSSYSTVCATCHTQTAWEPTSMNHTAVSGACSDCHTPPAGHSTGACSQCHSTDGNWTANLFVHPSIEEHESTSFACSRCHTLGYGNYTCLGCHDEEP